eukprot:6192794-Pleurochrysis_carterae.AAC.6
MAETKHVGCDRPSRMDPRGDHTAFSRVANLRHRSGSISFSGQQTLGYLSVSVAASVSTSRNTSTRRAEACAAERDCARSARSSTSRCDALHSGEGRRCRRSAGLGVGGAGRPPARPRKCTSYI